MDPRLQAEAEAQKEKLLDTRLSLGEKDKLYQFCQDKAMVLAVEKALLYHIYMMGTILPTDSEIPDANWAYAIAFNTTIDNEMLGGALRAKIEGLSFLDDSMKQIKKFGEKPFKLVEGQNPAL